MKQALEEHAGMASAESSTLTPIDLADSREPISKVARACYSAVLGAHTDRIVTDKSMALIVVRLSAGGDARDRDEDDR